jgi:Domain of unknown function (DUF4281)
MTEALFGVTFVLAAPFWALMMLAPTWGWTRRLAASPWIVVPPVLIYAVLAVPQLPTLLPVLLAPTLDGVREILATAAGTALAWAHFIAWDLFVGRWMYLDSRERDLSPVLMAPILLLTILLSPLGLLAYGLVRLVTERAGRPARLAEPGRM